MTSNSSHNGSIVPSNDDGRQALEPDRFANQFDATPSRESVSSTTEDPASANELSAQEEEEAEQLQVTAHQSASVLPRVTANYFHIAAADYARSTASTCIRSTDCASTR
jgi:hypothetical protein